MATLLATPTVAYTNPLTGTSIVAAITGDAGVTHTLYYRATGATAWTIGLTRVGDGSITQTGLAANTTYEFTCVSTLAGSASVPALPAIITTWTSVQSIFEQILVQIKTVLDELVVTADVTDVERPLRYDDNYPLRDKVLVIVQGDPVPDNTPSEGTARGAVGYQTWRLPVAIVCPIRPATSATGPVDAEINALVAKVHRKLLEDRSLAGLALNLDVEGMPSFGPDEPSNGRSLIVRVRCRHRETDMTLSA